MLVGRQTRTRVRTPRGSAVRTRCARPRGPPATAATAGRGKSVDSCTSSEEVHEKVRSSVINGWSNAVVRRTTNLSTKSDNRYVSVMQRICESGTRYSQRQCAYCDMARTNPNQHLPSPHQLINPRLMACYDIDGYV